MHFKAEGEGQLGRWRRAQRVANVQGHLPTRRKPEGRSGMAVKCTRLL